MDGITGHSLSLGKCQCIRLTGIELPAEIDGLDSMAAADSRDLFDVVSGSTSKENDYSRG